MNWKLIILSKRIFEESWFRNKILEGWFGMKIDRVKAKKVFDDYVKNYNSNDEKIKLKIDICLQSIIIPIILMKEK